MPRGTKILPDGRKVNSNSLEVTNIADAHRLLALRKTSGNIKVSDADFLAAAEAWDGRSVTELARAVNLDTSVARSRLKTMQTIFTQEAKSLCMSRALVFVRHLLEQSASGDTQATKIALEIAGVYNPRAQIDLTLRYQELLNVGFDDFTEEIDAAEFR